MKLKKMLIVGAALFAGVNAQAADTELEFWTMNLAPKFNSYFEQTTVKFNEANPGFKAKWVDMNWDQIQPKLTASIAAGNPPALVNFNVPWVHEFAAQGLILPVDQYLGAAKAAYSTNAVKDVQVKGQMFAFPWYNSTQIIAYNKDIFAKAGIKAAPKSFAEFVAMGKQIKAKTGQAAFAPKMSDMIGFFYYAGLPVVTDGKAVFNSPKHIAFVQTFADLYKAGVMPKDVFKMAFEQEIAAYNSGKIAMMTTAAQGLKRTETDAKAIYDKTEVAPFPLDAGKLNLGSWMMDFVIPKGTKDPAAAAKLGMFLTNDEQQLAFSKATESTMPSTKKANLDPYFQSGAKSADVVDRARAVAAKSMDNARTLTLAPGTLPDEVVMTKKLQEEIQAAVEGRKSVKDALNTAAAAWNEKLKK
ncbi:ABC transporter substrate-binding protein [Iodobacter fluviatilis]|uniref:Chitobiose transport system substrate-binding protein n=1 Tax=Iodobacter fluviatilis TaxID=537 RepID=A0A377Q3V9_9NEIS|nr:sugar ABC transporter substrate-binding protein [Iodobacter fluviatilis]TCU90455.1 putative chitobiose transport system substrate-binding protein [Iodobacter fluviatilis]STQ89482.1 Probable ABC transporter-binding protein DR_1438 precursor [Iodobacter fluviatilis]